jgi:hypothetical protein
MRSAFSVHPLLFGCLFVLMGLKQLLPYASATEFIWNLLAVLAGVTVLQLLFARFLRERHKAPVAASLCIIYFCFFGDFKALCEEWFLNSSWPALASARWVFPPATILFIVLFWLLVRSKRDFLTLTKYLNVLSGALVALNAAEVAWNPPAMPASANSQDQTPLRLGANPPDIYYILTDSYTSQESLGNFWHYDNSPFVNFLTQQGFHVVTNAHGNGSFTPRCLSISLNMNYPPIQGALSLPAQTLYYGRIIESAEAPARLKASGYEVTALSLFATAGQPRHYFFPKVSSATLASVLCNKTPLGYFTAYLTRATLGDTNLKILARLPDIAAQKTARPKFVYAHLMMPHAPFLFDREGRRIRRGMGMDDQSPDLYLDQLIYENKLLTNAIAGILKNSQAPPIIILQGDHGYRSLFGPHQQEEAFTILNALYLPGSKADWFYPGITPANTFRLIFNHYFDCKYPYLPDITPKTISPFISDSMGK